MSQPGPESAGMQLPAPMAEQPGGTNAPQNGGENMPAGQFENGPAAGAERSTGVQAPAMQMPAFPMPAPASTQQTPQQHAVSNTTSSVTPAVADDGDLIEKEWVNKAKQIVASTRDDPYRQSEQLTGVKADYMQKRYGKVIKVAK